MKKFSKEVYADKDAYYMSCPEPVGKHIAGNLKEFNSCVELCSAIGLLSVQLAKVIDKVYAVEIDKKRVENAVKNDYHKFIPIDEDLKGKYYGIGGGYKGVLFIVDYEACLAFRRKAQRRIPIKEKFREQILEDIKTSASDSKPELVKFYAWQVTQVENKRSAPDKIKVIEKYLK